MYFVDPPRSLPTKPDFSSGRHADNANEKEYREVLACFRHLPQPDARIHHWLSRNWHPENDGWEKVAYLLPNIEAFEVELARELFHDQAAKNAVKAAIVRLRNVLIELNPGVPHQDIERAFFHNSIRYANVGIGMMTLDELLGDENTTVRMLAVAFLNGAYRWRHDQSQACLQYLNGWECPTYPLHTFYVRCIAGCAYLPAIPCMRFCGEHNCWIRICSMVRTDCNYSVTAQIVWARREDCGIWSLLRQILIRQQPMLLRMARDRNKSGAGARLDTGSSCDGNPG